MRKVAVTGAGGFIGHHLVRYLKSKGEWVRGIDIKKPVFTPIESDEFILADLREKSSQALFKDIDETYALASDVGGVGYLSSKGYDLFADNTLINVNTLEGTLASCGKKLLFISSACIYPVGLQEESIAKKLKETEIFPVNPENSYGLEKLNSEFMFINAARDFKLNLRIARPQNVYGTEDLYWGEKAKAIGSLCYKVAKAKEGGEIEIWGDGEQTRSFCFVEDTAEGIYRLMRSEYTQPINLASEGTISINGVADILNKVSGKSLTYRHNLKASQGVRGRQSDLSLMKQVLGWGPQISLEQGLARTYRWVESNMSNTKD